MNAGIHALVPRDPCLGICLCFEAKHCLPRAIVAYDLDGEIPPYCAGGNRVSCHAAAWTLRSGCDTPYSPVRDNRSSVSQRGSNRCAIIAHFFLERLRALLRGLQAVHPNQPGSRLAKATPNTTMMMTSASSNGPSSFAGSAVLKILFIVVLP